MKTLHYSIIAIVAVILFATNYASAQTCPPAYSMNFEKLQYHPGDTVPIEIKSDFSGCTHLPTTASITVYNSTADGITENALYNESLQIVNDTWFNYTVPQWTDNNGLLHFLVRLTYLGSSGTQATHDLRFLSSDIKKSMSYKSENFTMWVEPSSIVNGTYTEALAKICPFAPATDNGTAIFLNYNITMPDGSKKLLQGELGPFDNCDTTWDRQIINANMIGTWSINTTAKWMENGTMHTLKVKPVELEVRKPLFESHKITELNVTKLAEISHVTSGDKPRFDVTDWSPDGKFILLRYDDYLDPSYDLHLALMDVASGDISSLDLPQNSSNVWALSDAKFLPTDNLILVANGNLFDYSLENKTLTQLTSDGDIYKVQSLQDGDLAYAKREANQNDSINTNFEIWLAHPNGTKMDDLLQAQNVESFNLSPDGKKIAMTVVTGGGCEYCAYTEGEVVDLDTKQTTVIYGLPAGGGEGKWSPAGDLIVWHGSSGGGAPGGQLTITDQTGGFEETLISGYDDPHSFAISPDGTSIIYGLNYHSEYDSSSGLYQMNLAKPIPEFPFAVPALLIGITSLIVFTRMRFRK